MTKAHAPLGGVLSKTDRLEAGTFSSWRRSLPILQQVPNRDADVPCGSCNACCRASLFIHVGAEDTEALAHIPAELLFPAPGLPAGNLLLGVTDEGCCPMLVDGLCSIYAFRPRTCRDFDCRIFPATGLVSEQVNDDGDPIAEQARRWVFATPAATDQAEHQAAKAAATYLRRHEASFAPGLLPRTNTQRALLALQLVDLFLSTDAQQASAPALLDVEARAVAIRDAFIAREQG